MTKQKYHRKKYTPVNTVELKKAVQYWDDHGHKKGITKTSVAAKFGIQCRQFYRYVCDDVKKRKEIGAKPGRRSRTDTLIRQYSKNGEKKCEEQLARRRLNQNRRVARWRLCKKRSVTAQANAMLKSVPVTTISAEQQPVIQVLPHFHYWSKTTARKGGFDASYPNLSAAKKRSVVELHQRMNENGNNQGQRARGFGYCGKRLMMNNKVLFITSNTDINITNRMCDKFGHVFCLKVRHFDPHHQVVKEFILNADSIARIWYNGKTNQTMRGVIEGGMKHFGVKKGAGRIERFAYAPTQGDLNGVKQWKGVNTFHRNLNVAAKKIARLHFNSAFTDIRRVMANNEKIVPEFLGGELGLCTEMVQSQRNLVTEAHVDLDHSKCFSIWSIREGETANSEGLYFLLPYLTCTVGGKKYHGIAVELNHGVGIEWSGRHIFHCSTAPMDRSINVYGTFFGITKNSI